MTTNRTDQQIIGLLLRLIFFGASESVMILKSFSGVPILNLGTHENFENARSVEEGEWTKGMEYWQA